MADDPRPTRQRIITEAMRLFGEQGYAATTIAQIEAAAGLSPGSGSLYRHFPSKQSLLAEGVRKQIAAGEELLSFISDPAGLDTLALSERLAVIARAGLARLDQERDLTRLLVRDLACFPDLLAEMGREEIEPIYQVVATWLAYQAGPAAPQRDWLALAAVLSTRPPTTGCSGTCSASTWPGSTRTATSPPWPTWQPPSSNSTNPGGQPHAAARSSAGHGWSSASTPAWSEGQTPRTGRSPTSRTPWTWPRPPAPG